LNIKYRINLFTNVFSMLVIIMSSYITIPIITKNLSISAYNYVALINNFVLFFSVLSFTLNSMLGKFYTIALDKSNNEANKFLSSAFFSILFLFLISSPLIIYFILEIQQFIKVNNELKMDVQVAFFLSYISLLITTLVSILNTIPYSVNKLNVINYNSIATNIFRIILIIYLFEIFTPHIWYVGFSNLLQNLLAIICSLYFFKKIDSRAKISIGNFRLSYSYKLISTGILNSVILFGNTLMLQTDLIIGNQFVDIEIMGAFAILLSFSTTTRSFSTAVSTSFSPITTKLYSEKNSGNMIKHIQKAIYVTSLMSFVPVILICTIGLNFLEIWLGYNFSNFEKILYIMMIPLGVSLSFYQLNVLFQTYDKLKFPAILTIFTGIITVIFSYIVGSKSGIIGIVTVSSIVFFIKNSIILPIYASKILSTSIFSMYKKIFTPLITSLLIILIANEIKKTIIFDEYSKIVIISIAIILIYFFLNKAIDFLLLSVKKRRNTVE